MPILVTMFRYEKASKVVFLVLEAIVPTSEAKPCKFVSVFLYLGFMVYQPL